MKKVTILMFSLFIATVMFGKTNVPVAVQQAFQKKFSHAEKVKWDQESPGEWEAEFKLNGTEMSASFDQNGTWIETEKKISKKELPEVVDRTVKKEFAEYKIEAVEKPGFSGYEMEVEKGETTFEVVISNTGEIVNKKAEGNDKD